MTHLDADKYNQHHHYHRLKATAITSARTRIRIKSAEMKRQHHELKPPEALAKKRRRQIYLTNIQKFLHLNHMAKKGRFQIITILVTVYLATLYIPHAHLVSIKPADFDRYVMSCYLGGGGASGQSSPYLPPPSSSGLNPLGSPSSAFAGQRLGPDGYSTGGGGQPSYGGRLSPGSGGGYGMNGNSGGSGMSGLGGPPPGPSGLAGSGLNGPVINSGNGNSGYQPPAYYGGGSSSGSPSDPTGRGGSSSYGMGRDAYNSGPSILGQQVPRANTIDNFIALVSKIEAANPRLATNPDQLIRILLSRFRMDNYYYDVRSRTPISEMDHRTLDLIPAILNGNQLQQMQTGGSPYMGSDVFPEQLLNHDEKCSMYFMLSHFIDKTTPLAPPLASVPINQLTGPQGSQRPPSLQAAGAGYPASSANNAFSGSGGVAGSVRYPGPAPSFGSPATSNMNSFAQGINNQPDYTGRNPYGQNVPQPNSPAIMQAAFNNNLRNQGQYSGTLLSNNRMTAPYIDGGNNRFRDDRMATEFGVVTVGNQDNAAIVLNRVLMGILAASIQPQSIRQLAAAIYPTQPLTNTPKIDEEIDPLYAVTLADLWAVSSIPKPGKPFDIRMLGDGGRWNDTMCPVSFHLDRANSIRFTTAELIGGIDGLNLGMFRRRLRRNMRLSELLRMYYSRAGFRPQFAEVGVCNRPTAINSQLDDLHRQAENYLRLYQLNLPTADNEIAISIQRVDVFKDIARQVAQQYAPPDVCQDSSFNDIYPMSPQDQCEVAKADVVAVLDSSPQANTAFMNMVVIKLAQKLSLSREGSSLTVLTNQQDTTGYAGAYSFNAIIRNSTNTAEIGCSLVHDKSQSYQGGQITDPTRLMEMFERALVTLDTEYLTRQTMQSNSMFRQSSSAFISSLVNGGGGGMMGSDGYLFGPAPKNTGGAKVIVWFTYGPAGRMNQIAPGPTNWNGPPGGYGSNDNEYRFQEAKRNLRENFRGATVLAISSSRDNVKGFVYDEDRDVFTDIPQGNGEGILSTSSGDIFSSSGQGNSWSSDPMATAALAGPTEQLVNKLLQRMCDIPTMFQYPMCFRSPSDNTIATGYISPGRRQYWMMSPKTFFASRAIRLAFRVDGGRLKVCFGRQPKPDETFARSDQQQSQYLQPGNSAIQLTSGSGSGNGLSNQQSGIMSGSQQTRPVSASSSDYYTGMEHGVCKDVSPGQEIEFVISDPCWKKSIADCEPFYFVIKETSNPGEGDPNYICRDEGCKRFDQAKFIMTHTGVTCSSALSALKANWVLVLISMAVTCSISAGSSGFGELTHSMGSQIWRRGAGSFITLVTISATLLLTLAFTQQQVSAQQANVYDYGQGRYGEKRGSFTPSEWLAIILVIMTILGGLALTIGLCYYVAKQAKSGLKPVQQEDY